MSGHRLEDIEVQVLVDETWLDAWPDAWDNRRRAMVRCVRYRTAPAENHLDRLQQAQIRHL